MTLERTGTIKWFSISKGYGFIVPDDTGPEVFVHASVVHRCGLPTTLPNTRVAYVLDQSQHCRASTVRIADVDVDLATNLLSRAKQLIASSDAECRLDGGLMRSAAMALIASAMPSEQMKKGA